MLIDHDGKNLNVDPGPGALVQMHRIHYDPFKTMSLIISHCHPDHYSDAESIIEGMSHGGWIHRGNLYGSETVIRGLNGLGPCISPYHLGLLVTYNIFEPGDVLNIDGLKTEIKKADHSDPTNVGFIFHTAHGKVAYVSDTVFTREIAEQYVGCRVLILPVTTPAGEHIKYHLNTDDAAEFAKIVRPELVILVHLGIVMLAKDPEAQARIIEDRSGIKTIAGRDLMVLDVEEDLVISYARVYNDNWIPDSAPLPKS